MGEHKAKKQAWVWGFVPARMEQSMACRLIFASDNRCENRALLYGPVQSARRRALCLCAAWACGMADRGLYRGGRPSENEVLWLSPVFFMPGFSPRQWTCSAGEYGMETVSALLNLVFRITGKPPAALTFFCQVPIIYGCWKYSSVPAVRRRYGVREGNRQRR